MSKPEAKRLQGWHHLIIFLAACVLFVSRRPDAIFHAQFFAEDGFTFYADAYNLGWFSALLRPYAGYFHLVPRLAAGLALLVPFYRAPLVMNIVALAMDALPVNLLLSSRCAAWGSLRFRAVLAVAYIASPVGPIEIFSIITSVQWVLVIAAFMVVAGSLPRNKIERICDVLLLLASGLSGPFCFFLFPIAAVIAYRRRERWLWVRVTVLLLTASVQGWAMLAFRSGASSATLGATPYFLLRILSENVYLGTIFGAGVPTFLTGAHTFRFELLVALAGTLVAAALFSKARMQMKLFCVMAGMALAAGLISPTSWLPASVPRWPLLAQAHGIRYWFLPTLALIWLLIDTIQNKSKVLKPISETLLLLFCIVTPFLWQVSIFRDFDFKSEAARFEAAPAGAAVTIPLNPVGRPMNLIKHGGEGQ